MDALNLTHHSSVEHVDPYSFVQVIKDALVSAEQDGIVFIDEIDKIVSGPNGRFGGKSHPSSYIKSSSLLLQPEIPLGPSRF